MQEVYSRIKLLSVNFELKNIPIKDITVEVLKDDAGIEKRWNEIVTEQLLYINKHNDPTVLAE